MNSKIKLVSLGATVAIALLPTQARANTPTPLAETDSPPSTLTSVEPLPKGELEGLPAKEGPEDRGPEAVVSDAIAPDASQQSPDITVVEPINATVNASPDPSDNAQAEALLLTASTNSDDLQPVGSIPTVADVISAPLVQPANIAQAATPPQSDQWHFLLVPYVYVPLSISGSANYEGSEDFRNDFSGNLAGSRDFDFTPTQIRSSLENSLNFAFLGGFEAWTPDYTLGVLANIDYLSLTSDDTLNRSVRRPGFANFVPTELNASLDTQVWNVDLAASYRFYDPARANPQGLNTEYDLGPFVFDVLGGLNVTSLNTQLDLSTNLGGEGEFTTSKTVVSPLLGGRFRWNATPELAVVLSGSVSGFGIGGLTQYGVLGGVNWMFSGNTSVGLGYRFGFLDYDSGSSEVDLNVDQNGPYLNFGFRF
ncbi:outer membrane protein [Halomicronema sp. CCY15110]|uniref:outer membrane protein n=1 Tax=Halomicronema sp. CCY15110 TaxID=2767773 RepID=UPI00194E3AAF|nr:hypothetical protein [Halomicronema sp. CCY15110]